MRPLLQQAIDNLKDVMAKEGIDPTKGLPEELFLFATTLVPCVNIDLFITDDMHRLLLTWRDDIFYGKGWHIPGGCVRLKESLDKRIQLTAMNEINTRVICDYQTFITRELIIAKEERPLLSNQLERCHNISMLFNCRLPAGFEVKNKSGDEHSSGYMKWFDHYPNDFLAFHKTLYGDIINEFFKRK